ncbi:MAG: hypothetical protein ACTS46_00375 [Candidatus Hodgkinia cicadicola]
MFVNMMLMNEMQILRKEVFVIEELNKFRTCVWDVVLTKEAELSRLRLKHENGGRCNHWSRWMFC